MRYFEQELERLHTEPRAVSFYDGSMEVAKGLSFLQRIIPFDGWAVHDAAGRSVGADARTIPNPEQPDMR